MNLRKEIPAQTIRRKLRAVFRVVIAPTAVRTINGRVISEAEGEGEGEALVIYRERRETDDGVGRKIFN